MAKSKKITTKDILKHILKPGVKLTKKITTKDILKHILKPGVKLTELQIDPKKVEELKENLKKTVPMSRTRGGLIMPRYCSCGKYQPKSTKGLIDYSCRNCGGQKKTSTFN